MQEDDPDQPRVRSNDNGSFTVGGKTIVIPRFPGQSIVRTPNPVFLLAPSPRVEPIGHMSGDAKWS